MSTSCFCARCSVFTNSVRDMLHHVMGRKHVSRVGPEELKLEGRLQYFVETYLDSVPVLGLEYMVETPVDPGYHYTCSLCDASESWRNMAIHITSACHMERYMRRHHKGLITRHIWKTQEERQIYMTNAASTIPSEFGCGKKHTAGSTAVDNPPNQEAGMGNGDPPPASDDFQKEQGKTPPHCPVMREEALHPKTVPLLIDGVLSDDPTYYCSLCGVSNDCPTSLCDHVLSKKHRRKLSLIAPGQLKDVGRLCYFLQNYLKEFPILGLEYIVQIGQGPFYKFTCQLCCIKGELPKIINHLTDTPHTVMYIKKHYGSMVSSFQNIPNKREYVKAVRDVAERIVEIHGRKEFQLKMTTAGDLTKAESLPKVSSQTRNAIEDQGDVPPSKHDRLSGAHSERRPSPDREAGLDESRESPGRNAMEENSDSDGSPSPKKGRLLPESNQDALPSRPHTSEYGGSSYNERLDYTTAEHELEFRTNDQFLQYLINFSIGDNKDGIFIQQITQNCIKALTSFWEEEIMRQKSSHQAEVP